MPLDPRSLVTPTELRDIILSAQPDAQHIVIENAITSLYNEFLDRLLVILYPDRALSPSQADSVATWLNARNPNITVLDRAQIARAVARHAQIFPPGDSLALDDAESIAATDLSLGSDEDADDAGAFGDVIGDGEEQAVAGAGFLGEIEGLLADGFVGFVVEGGGEVDPDGLVGPGFAGLGEGAPSLSMIVKVWPACGTKAPKSDRSSVAPFRLTAPVTTVWS